MTQKIPSYLRELRQSLEYALDAINERYVLLAPLAGALLAWSILQHDPFGLEKASNAASRRVVLRLLAAVYPKDPGQVSVLLIDDAYLREVRESWPLSYRAQGAILRTVLNYEPKAVFIDILYRHRHLQSQLEKTNVDSPQALVDAVRKTPTAAIILADLPRKAIYEHSSKRNKEAECVPVRYGTLTDASPEQTMDAIDDIVGHAKDKRWNVTRARVGWMQCNERYPLLIGKASDYSPEPDDRVTPAYALYRAGCQASSGSGCKVDRAATEELEPVVLRWGAFPSQLHVESYGDEDDKDGDGDPIDGNGDPDRKDLVDVCQPPLRCPLQQSVELILNQIARSFDVTAEDSSDRRVRLPCPAVDTFYASELTTGHSERLDRLLRNRYVIIGARLDGIPDFVLSPVNGLVPGATFHAAALDNLLRFEDDYVIDLSEKRRRALELGILIGVALLVAHLWRRDWFARRGVIAGYGIFATFVFLAVALFGSVFAAVSLGALLALSLWQVRTTTMFVFVLVVGLAIEFILVLGLSIAPGNWIGMLLSTVAGMSLGEIERQDCKKGATI